MSKQIVNLGTAPSGSGGDTPRSAFVKTQANVDELYAALGAAGSPQALPAALPVANGGTGGNTKALAYAGLGLADFTASLALSALSARGSPSIANNGGLHLGWNASGNAGEANFVCNNQGAVGGFTWRSINLANTAAGPTMTYSYTGNLSIPLSLTVPTITGMTTPLTAAQGGTGRSDNRILASEAGVQSAAALYGAGNQGMYMGWNSAGQGEGHFVVNQGGGSGGFTWRTVNSGNTASGPQMSYAYDGTLRVPGSVYITGACLPNVDGGSNLGISSQRWATVYAVTGAINTSDAREKTAVAPFTANELSAAKSLGKEIGNYQFLASVAEKGDAARHHIGMTVQRAIEIMEANGLLPMMYAFICYDEWPEVPEVSTTVIRGNIYSAGDLAQENVTYLDYEPYAQFPSFTWEETSRSTVITQVFKPAGNLYGFRYDQLAMFIARGQEQRLADLEAKLEAMTPA